MSEHESVSVEDGKYTVRIHDDGRLDALRHGEPWQDLTGNKLVYCLATELRDARQALSYAELRNADVEALRKRTERAEADKLALMDRLQAAIKAGNTAPPDPVLCKFYSVDSYPELVQAQASHIERLQAKLPAGPSLAPRRTRAG